MHTYTHTHVYTHLYIDMYMCVYIYMDDHVRFQRGGFISTSLILCPFAVLGSDEVFCIHSKTENG